MENTKKTNDWTNSIAKSATDIVLYALILILVVVAGYWFRFGGPFGTLPKAETTASTAQTAGATKGKISIVETLEERRASQAVWGQLGDYVGGILNPLLSFVAIFMLMRTIQLQQIQIGQTEVALATASATNEIASLAAALEVISEDLRQMQETPGFSDVEAFEKARKLKVWLAREIAKRAQAMASRSDL